MYFINANDLRLYNLVIDYFITNILSTFPKLLKILYNFKASISLIPDRQIVLDKFIDLYEGIYF